MKEHRHKNLEGRNKLIEKLTQEYITASASKAVSYTHLLHDTKR